MRCFLTALAFLIFLADLAAADEPKIIAAGAWSKPVADSRGYALRGRLVLCERAISDDRREIAVYVELQDACDFIGGEVMQLFCDLGKHDFRPEYKGGLSYEMTDKDGNAVPIQPFPFSGAAPRSDWYSLPSDATIRLRTSPFGVHRPGALAIAPDLGKLWVIGDDDEGVYLLKSSFTIDPHAGQKPAGAGHVWRGLIDLPALTILGRKAAARSR